MSTPLIELQKLRIRNAHHQILVDEVSLQLQAGECLALVGESGAGKTLTAKTLLGLLPDGLHSSAARFQLFGEDARGYRSRDWRSIRGRRMGFIVQEALAALDPLRKIGAEIAEPLVIHRMLPKAAQRGRVLELLRQQQIPEPELRMRQYSHELSGGQRQRALIASVLAGEPRVIIADEPTASLDTVLAAAQLDHLAQLKAQGYAIVLISHDLAAVAKLADQILVMRSGRVLEQGAASEILQHPTHDYTKQLVASARHTELLSSSQTPTDPTSPVVLEAAGVSKRYRAGAEFALKPLDLQLRQGEVLGIVGESGSGKSTLARILLAAESASSGSVTLFGEPWSDGSEAKRRLRRHLMQWVPQDPLSSFDPRWRIRGILNEPLRQRPQALSNSEAELRRLMQMVELSPELLNRRPRELSGGQRQRVAIARALALGPKILICDEAVSALDVTVQATILQLLNTLRRELDLSIVFITHDLGVIRHFSDRVMVLRDGELVESGPTTQLLETPQHPYTQQLMAASLQL